MKTVAIPEAETEEKGDDGRLAPPPHYFQAMISDEKIQEFKVLYRKHFGIELSDEEAQEKGSQLLRLLEIVYKPMTEEDLAIVEERRKITHSGPAQ